MVVLFTLLMFRYVNEKLYKKSCDIGKTGDFYEENAEKRQIIADKFKKEYLRGIHIRTVILSAICALVGILSFAEVFVNGRVKLIFTNPSDVTMPTVIAPMLPWFSLLLTAVTVAYFLYSIYYFNMLKDELN